MILRRAEIRKKERQQRPSGKKRGSGNPIGRGTFYLILHQCHRH